MAIQPETDVSADYPFEVHHVDIFGSKMSYIDTQHGEPTDQSMPIALLLHGNVSSSYIWRNIIPHVSPLMRCIAPDLIGMGNSSKPAHMSWRFTDHYTFLSAFIKAVVPSGPVFLVLHDWGSGLGLHWAYQQAEINSDRVAGLALMEFVRPFTSLEDMGLPKPIQEAFRGFRDPVKGHQMIIEENLILEKVLPTAILRGITEAELAQYRRPFLEKASRQPLLVWTTQIPVADSPSDVYDIATRYHEWLLSEKCTVPKLLFWASPGDLISPEKGQWYMERLKNVTGVNLGAGRHYLQEDHPHAIGREIFTWAKEIMEAHEN